MAKWSHDKIYFSSRGVVHLPLGGQEHTLRFRSHEIDQLEQKLGMGVMSILQSENIGIRSLKQAIIVGVSHEYVGKKGQSRKTLTEQEVGRWIDNSYERDGIEFEDLQEAVMRAIIGGLPNGAKLISQMDKEDDANDEGSPAPLGSDSHPAEDKPEEKKKVASTGTKSS